jgi:tetratricopeptide (TPR) repeat protein
MIGLTCLAWIVALLAGSEPQEPPWDASPFASQPAAILEAAEAITAENADVIVLLEEARRSFDEQGRCEKTFRTVFRVLTPAGVENWGTVSSEWSPWHEERPRIRARVCTKSRQVFELDPATIDVAPARDDQDHVYDDDQIARAPLPGIEVGAVVEQEVSIHETSASFAAGTCSRFYFGQNVPVQHTRLALSAPESLPLRWTCRMLEGLVPERRIESGRVSVSFDRGPMPPRREVPSNLPFDQPRWSYVAFATGASWAGVASAYHDLVERQIAPEAVSEVARNASGRSEAGEKETTAVVAALLSYLRREVRYTGLEFGVNSIIPHTSAETLARKYGDCKDQASLLVALLRSLGITAHVALLRSGFGEDVDAELPGLGWFNHAIVYIPGESPLWVDPTSRFARAGRLPQSDQGRLALIAAPETAGLTMTPVAAAEDNRAVETREILLGEDGTARVMETTETWGAIEESYRSFYDRSSHDDNQKQLTEYLESEYSAKVLDAFDHSASDDFDRPFRLRVEGSQALCVSMDDKQAVITLRSHGLWDRLPSAITERKEEDGKGAAAPPRAQDFIVPEPFVYEHHYRIVPPPGFMVRELPAAEEKLLGAAKLTRTFASADDGSVTASFRFDSGPRRLSVDDFVAMRTGIAALAESPRVSIAFDQVGESLVAQGRIAEALVEFRRLASLHPTEARHHAQIANTLLEAGLGEAAREAAARGVEIEPDSALAHRVRAWVLQHDLVGRLRRSGFDREGAIAEYRKAKSLDPTDYLARGDLAILLEHDADGLRYGRHSSLEEAIGEYRALRVDLDDHRFDKNLLVALLRARKVEDLHAETRQMTASDTRNAYLVAAIAAKDGPPAALKEATKLTETQEQRRALIRTAAPLLNQLRRYPEASALFEAAARGAADAAALSGLATSLAGVRPYEQLQLPDDDPVSLVKRFFIWIYLGENLDQKSFTSFYTDEVAATVTTAEGDAATEVAKTVRSVGAKSGAPLDTLTDLVMSTATFSSQGDRDKGYRIMIRSTLGDRPTDELAFVTSRNGTLKLAAFGKQTIGLVGIEVLHRVGENDLAGAKQWLNWARDLLVPASGDDPFAGTVFPHVWKSGQEADAATIRRAAASLVADSEAAAIALPILLEARQDVRDESERVKIDFALAKAYFNLKKPQEVLDAAERLRAAHPTSLSAFVLQEAALGKLGRWSDVEARAKQRLFEFPDDRVAQDLLADAALHRQDFDAAERIYADLIASGKAQADQYNMVAWSRLFRRKITDEDIGLARQAVALTHQAESGSLHTLASLYAEAGKCAEAREIILKSLDVSGHDGPRAADWYVFGRIAEQYGERSAALAMYRRVTRPESGDDGLSTFELARRRIDAIEQGDGNR